MAPRRRRRSDFPAPRRLDGDGRSPASRCLKPVLGAGASKRKALRNRAVSPDTVLDFLKGQRCQATSGGSFRIPSRRSPRDLCQK